MPLTEMRRRFWSEGKRSLTAFTAKVKPAKTDTADSALHRNITGSRLNTITLTDNSENSEGTPMRRVSRLYKYFLTVAEMRLFLFGGERIWIFQK